MRQFVQTYYRKHPLRLILWLGLFLRIIAAIFSRGYAFTDDHYFVIEEAQQWIFQGASPSSFWHPWVSSEDRLSHSSFYTTLHYFLFQAFRWIHVENPLRMMLVVRLLHALYSLLIVYFGYRITKLFDQEKTAKNVAWILALAWFMPFLSVRNLVEMVCIPPLLGAAYLIQRYPKQSNFLFLAGILSAIAFALRFQTALISGMFGLVLLFQKQWREAISLGIGFVLGSAIFLGVLDFWLFGEAFHELISYIDYNLTHAGEYPSGPWYQYIWVFLGMFPLFLGGIWFTSLPKTLKSWPLLAWAFLAFFLFHSYFPNKQERFILPIVPFFIILGTVSWSQWRDAFPSKKKEQWQRISTHVFWVLNTLILIPMLFASTKTAKLDAMDYLRRQPDAQHFVIESSHTDYMEYMPRFYGNFWKPYQHILNSCDAPCFYDSIATGLHPNPNYVLFFDTNNLADRVQRFRKIRKIEYKTTIKSSWLDELIPKLNPVVKSQIITIYRVLPTAPSTPTVKTATTSESAESARTTSSKTTTAAESTTTEKNGRRIKTASRIASTTSSSNK